MASSIEEPDWELSPQGKFIWKWQTNDNPWDTTQIPQWTPYSDAISSSIEDAYNQQLEHILINENYRIDFKYRVQQYIHNTPRQRPVRRLLRSHSMTIPNADETEAEASSHERLSSPLGLALQCSATGDLTYYGSSFVHDWLGYGSK